MICRYFKNQSIESRFSKFKIERAQKFKKKKEETPDLVQGLLWCHSLEQIHVLFGHFNLVENISSNSF